LYCTVSTKRAAAAQAAKARITATICLCVQETMCLDASLEAAICGASPKVIQQVAAAMRPFAVSTATACYWHRPHSTRSSRPSVCLSQHSSNKAGLLLLLLCAADIDRSIAARRTASSRCGQCHDVSRRKRLNADVLLMRAF